MQNQKHACVFSFEALLAAIETCNNHETSPKPSNTKFINEEDKINWRKW